MIPFHDFEALKSPAWFRKMIFDAVVENYQDRKQLCVPRLVVDTILAPNEGRVLNFNTTRTRNGYSAFWYTIPQRSSLRLPSTYPTHVEVSADHVTLTTDTYGPVQIHRCGGVAFPTKKMAALYAKTGVVFTRNHTTGFVDWPEKKAGVLPRYLREHRTGSSGEIEQYEKMLCDNLIPFFTNDEDTYVLV